LLYKSLGIFYNEVGVHENLFDCKGREDGYMKLSIKR